MVILVFQSAVTSEPSTFSEADQTVDRRNIVRPSMKTMERKHLCETKHAAGCPYPFSVSI